MEKKDIIALFLRAGVLLRHEELEWLTRQEDSVIAQIASSPTVKDELARHAHAPKFDIIKNLTAKPQSAMPALQTKFLNSRYEQMRAITSQRIQRNWISISRLLGRGEVWLTGIVRNIKEGDKTVIELEDPTGTTAVVFNTKPDAQLDDFIAVHASVAGRVVFGKEILHPDIPIRPATKGSGRGCFISDLHLEEASPADAKRLFSAIAAENVDWLFVSGDTGNLALLEELATNVQTFLVPGEADTTEPYPQLPLRTERRNIASLSNPAVVRVGGLVVLLCHRFETDMLRKRHLGSSEALEQDYLVLDCVPDIVGCGHDHKPLVSNYKATTIVNAGSLLTQSKPVVVDFASREWKQLSI